MVLLGVLDRRSHRWRAWITPREPSSSSAFVNISESITKQRDLVAQVVFLAEDHLSVEGIRRELKQRGKPVGMATVYRTLDLLVESGLVRTHEFGEGFRRYEAIAGQSGHEHLICQQCGRVVEFANERLERMLPALADEHGFQHRRHKVEIYGVCRACRQRELGPW